MLTLKSYRNSKAALLIMKSGLYLTILFLICFVTYKLAWSQPYQAANVTSPSIAFNTIQQDDINVHYAYAGDTEKPGVIFVHGTPGDWAAFEAYLLSKTLRDDFFVVSVDRPGWGKSQTQDKKLNGVFDHQARSIKAIFDHYPNKKWIVVGHSLGASLAPQIALESQASVSGMVLLAGSLKPRLGNPRWYNYAASTWLVSKMIGDTMTRANREVMKLRKQLKLMNESLEDNKLNIHVVIVQGLKDKLVSPKNPAFANQQWQDNFASLEIVELEEAGHFLPWDNPHHVLKSIFDVANKVNQQ